MTKTGRRREISEKRFLMGPKERISCHLQECNPRGKRVHVLPYVPREVGNCTNMEAGEAHTEWKVQAPCRVAPAGAQSRPPPRVCSNSGSNLTSHSSFLHF